MSAIGLFFVLVALVVAGLGAAPPRAAARAPRRLRVVERAVLAGRCAAPADEAAREIILDAATELDVSFPNDDDDKEDLAALAA